MNMTSKQVFQWGLTCLKKALILIIPMFVVAGYLLDISIQAKYHYPNNTSVYFLQLIGIIFYLSCAVFILFPPNKWNQISLLISSCLLIGTLFLNKDIQKIHQHAKCVESVTSCPKGVVLDGG